MRYQEYTRDKLQTIPLIVDEDHGIPTNLIDDYRSQFDSGPLGPTDPRSILLSMSEYGKAQNYNAFDYHSATRPDQAADYAPFDPTHPQYASEYVVSTLAQATPGVPHSSDLPYLPPSQATYEEGPHDPAAYYTGPAAGHPSAYAASTPTYVDPGIRQLPQILSYSPYRGAAGTKVSICFQSIYDLQSQPQTTIVIMFGRKRCDSVLSRSSHSSSPYQYVIQADAPPLTVPVPTTTSPQVPLVLSFDGPAVWQSPTLEVGTFTYDGDYSFTTPMAPLRKRKLSLDADERLSPAKKQNYSHLSALPAQPHFAPDVAPLPAVATASRSSDAGSNTHRRYSQPEYAYPQSLPRVHTQQYYTSGPVSASARLQTELGPATYGYPTGLQHGLRSPIATVIPATRTAQLLPSPASGTPQLIRTSTIQQSPSTPGIPHSTTQSFNPYAMYPANSKAMLKIEGNLDSMVEGWTEAEWGVKRRLVQFQRSQQGSIISTTFEATTPADRLPNSICVSCIWWEEKSECYVTSVDTIQLLESLVAVRFTVEEKNRIRRNLEGFRPATVSKTKADSEDFFKLIMGFPNPKPRNIEKDVKVFPWRILSTALKKIIGKYSASYSSTAGALHSTPTASTYLAARVTDAGNFAASPRSTSSSSTTHGHSYATAALNAQTFLPHNNPVSRTPIDLSTGPHDMRLAVSHQSLSGWQDHEYRPQLGASASIGTNAPAARSVVPWDYPTAAGGYGIATGLPAVASGHPPAQYQFGAMRIPAQNTPVAEARFVPLHDYEEISHQTSAPP